MHPKIIMGAGKRIRILSVEDHPVFRQGLATVIETEPDMVLVGQVHIKNLVDKLGAKDRKHTVTIALRRGLLAI